MTTTYRIVGDMSRAGRIEVLVAGQRIGEIVPIINRGYVYLPAGSKIFKTINECKASLEAE